MRLDRVYLFRCFVLCGGGESGCNYGVSAILVVWCMVVCSVLELSSLFGLLSSICSVFEIAPMNVLVSVVALMSSSWLGNVVVRWWAISFWVLSWICSVCL